MLSLVLSSLPALSQSRLGSFRNIVGSGTNEKTWYLDLTHQEIAKTDVDLMFKNLYSKLHNSFDFDTFRNFSSNFVEALESYDVYKPVDSNPHCDTGLDTGKLVTNLQTTHVAPL